MSSKNKKQQPVKQPVKLSPFNYIKTKARSLPWGKCYINDNWKLSGMATIMMSRMMAGSDKHIVGIYLIDTFCLGLKNSGFRFSIDGDAYQELRDEYFALYDTESEEAHPILLQNIIYGAIEYAEDLGFQPHKSFDQTEYILDPADKIGYIDLEFGKDGKPLYVQGPHDNKIAIIKKLNRVVGPDNYQFLSRADILNESNKFDEYVENNNHLQDDEDSDEDDDSTGNSENLIFFKPNNNE